MPPIPVQTREVVFLRPFKFAHEGIRVEEFAPNPGKLPVAVSARCAEVALANGFARLPIEPEGPAAPLPLPAKGGGTLRDDGPTIEEYCKAGHLPQDYPPEGYAEKPSKGLTRYRKDGKFKFEGVEHPLAQTPPSRTTPTVGEQGPELVNPAAQTKSQPEA